MIQKIVCTGEPFTLGEEYGLQCLEQIRGCLEETQDLLARKLGIAPKLLVQKAVNYFQPYIQRFTPNLWEEIRGIAAATDTKVEQILFLQTINEFLYGSLLEGTAISVSNRSSPHPSSLIGLNLDFDSWSEKYLVLREINYPNSSSSILMLALAGTLGWAGINAHSLTAFSTGLESAGVQKGLPASILVRWALEQNQLSEMVKIITESPRSSPRNFLLGSISTCLSLETTISQTALLYPSSEGILIHTNHFLAPKFQEIDTGIVKWPESLERFQRLQHLVSQHQSFTPEDLQTILADHVHFPKGVCRHDAGTKRPFKTIASLIAIPSQSALQICQGNPCTGKYFTYSLTENKSVYWDRE